MKTILSLLALGATFVSGASAALLIDEQFTNNLSNGTTILGQAGSSGDNWGVSGTGSTSALYQSSSLTGPGPWSSGLGGSLTLGFNTPVVQQAFTLDNTGNRYFSFLFRNNASGTYTRSRVVFEAFGSSNEGYGLDIDFTAGAEPSLALSARAGSGDVKGTPFVTTTVNTTLLVVGKFVANGGTTTLWINPTDFTNEASVIATALGTSTFSNAAVTRDDGIGFRSTTNSNFTVDALRLGTSLADVVSPVPEPASIAALAGLGALGLALTRRRRRA
jgi:hypothetical protein